MKNPLVSLKQKEHQHALYTVLIFIMLCTLFFLLASLKSPLKSIDKVTENSPIEIEFIQTEITPSNTSEAPVINKQGPISTDQDKVFETIDVADIKPTEEQTVDHSFSFNQTDQQSGNNTIFGENSNDIKESGLEEFSSGNRKVVLAPTFVSESQEEGRIALKIWVDGEGHVVKTELEPTKSSSGSSYLIGLANKAAKTMKYSADELKRIEFVGTEVFVFKKV